MLHGSSLCAWLYTLALSLLNGVVGGGLVALCYKSFSTPTHEIGIVLRMCLVTGIVMVVFVFFWIIFIFSTWMGSGQVTQECQSKKEMGTTSRLSSRVTSLLGLLSLIMLMLSIMVDLSMTGLMWWTSHHLGDQYQVRGDCFCERSTRQSVRGMRDIFSINCPSVEGFMCEAVFGAVKVTMHSVTVSTTECQRLDGSQQDPACLEYLTFWNLFKVLRIMLPLLALVKLPVLLGNCSRWLCKEHKQKYKSSQGKFATDSVSWIGLDVLISPLRLVDPVQFYSDICAPVSAGALGERLGPIGQENDDDGSLPSKPAMTGNSRLITSARKTSQAYLPATVPPCSTVQKEFQTSDGMTIDDSPPDIEKHTISTPKHPRLKTPRFDLSKVVKPDHLHRSPETAVPNTRLFVNPDVIPHKRLSSFSASQDFKIPPPPPLPKPNLSELQSHASHHPPPPFSRSTATLPRPVHISSSDAYTSHPHQSLLEPRISNQLSPPPTPTVQLASDYSSDYDNSDSVQSASSIVRLQPHHSHSVRSSPKWQGSNIPLQLVSPSIREISQKARKGPSSTVDWTKLP